MDHYVFAGGGQIYTKQNPVQEKAREKIQNELRKNNN